MTEPTKIDSILRERGEHYGSFVRLGENAQRIKRALREGPNWDNLDDDQKEALDTLATKLARILSGDPDIVDHWLDAAGYMKLISDRLEREAVTEAEIPKTPRI